MVVSGSFPDGVPAFGSGTMVSVIPLYSILLDIIDVSIRFTASVAGWSSLVARRAHNPKVAGSNPAPATKEDFNKRGLH